MAYSQPIAPRSGRTRSRRCGQATNDQRHSLGSAHRRALARYARTIWQLELGLRALFALEQARGLGCGVRNAGFSRAPGRRGTCHRFHDCAGAPTCSRRKRGNQKQEALGRSRGGFSTKIHLRTNANGEPLTFDAYRGQPCGARERRAVTDEVMKSIQALSGQEYVPIYASVRKEQLAAANGTGQDPPSRGT